MELPFGLRFLNTLRARSNLEQVKGEARQYTTKPTNMSPPCTFVTSCSIVCVN